MSHATLALLLTFAIPSFAKQVHPASTIAAMRDRYRPLLVFQPKKDQRLDAQLSLLTVHRADLIDRQILLVLRPYAWSGIVDNDILNFRSWKEDKELRRRFHIHRNDFTVILLGKDGGEKFRSHTPVTMDQLTRIIDAMSMRQSEMRAQPKH